MSTFTLDSENNIAAHANFRPLAKNAGIAATEGTGQAQRRAAPASVRRAMTRGFVLLERT